MSEDEDAIFLQARRELTNKINNYFKELSEEYQVPPPKWEWSTMPWYHSAIALIGLKTNIIFIGDYLIGYYVVDPSLCWTIVKWTCAHEFCHYLQNLEGKPISNLLAEIKANEFATTKTKMSKNEQDILFQKLVNKFVVSSWNDRKERALRR